jgi:hypothetical protein
VGGFLIIFYKKSIVSKNYFFKFIYNYIKKKEKVMDVKEKRKEIKKKVLEWNLILAQENMSEEKTKYIRNRVSRLITEYLNL